MKKLFKTVCTVMLSGIFLFAGATGAKADSPSGSVYEEGRSGTVTVTLADEDQYNQEKPVYVDGAELTLVKIALLKADGTYVAEEAFRDAEGLQEYMNGGTASDAETASRAAAEIASAGGGTVVDRKTTGSDGSAVLTAPSGEYGIYLLYQTRQSATSERYSKISPTLVQIPGRKENAWIYDVTLTPKLVKHSGVSVQVRKRSDQSENERVVGAELSVVSAEQTGSVLDSWTTGSDADHDTVALQTGKYILKETKVPAGYTKAADIVFEITDEGTVLVNGTVMEDNAIVMVDPVVKQTVTPTPLKPSSIIQNIVKTGDTTNLVAWIVLIAAAVTLLVILLKKKSEK
jgi:hypothetical protein